VKRRALIATTAAVMIGVAVFVGVSHALKSRNAHRLSSSEYEVLRSAYDGLEAGVLALLDGIQSPREMEFDIAVTIQETPSRNPGGACGTELIAYRTLLHRYASAVHAGALFGPPSFGTISQREERVAQVCKPIVRAAVWRTDERTGSPLGSIRSHQVLRAGRPAGLDGATLTGLRPRRWRRPTAASSPVVVSHFTDMNETSGSPPFQSSDAWVTLVEYSVGEVSQSHGIAAALSVISLSI
jgi:hypothetical protein